MSDNKTPVVFFSSGAKKIRAEDEWLTGLSDSQEF